MRKIIEYKAVTGGNIIELNQSVQALIDQGFEPFYGVSSSVGFDTYDNMCHYVNTQAMVLYGEEDV